MAIPYVVLLFWSAIPILDMHYTSCRLRCSFILKHKAHYNDVIMGVIASQITSLTIVYSTVYSDADQRKHKAPRHWPLCGEFTGDRPNSQLCGKCFHLMTSSWICIACYTTLDATRRKTIDHPRMWIQEKSVVICHVNRRYDWQKVPIMKPGNEIYCVKYRMPEKKI